MLTPAKKQKMLSALKSFQKKYFRTRIDNLDESGTRLLINDLLSLVLGYQPIEEIKTEYMIRGTYAEYVVQTKGDRHFLVEVKALSLNLSDKHLRQTINYGANEGIEWAVLTNGRQLELYKITFDKPIDSKLIFKADISDPVNTKKAVEWLQFLHKDAVLKKSLKALWNRSTALDHYTIAEMLFTKNVVNFLRRELKRKYKSKFEEGDVKDAILHTICEAHEPGRINTSGKKQGRPMKKNKTSVRKKVMPVEDPYMTISSAQAGQA